MDDFVHSKIVGFSHPF